MKKLSKGAFAINAHDLHEKQWIQFVDVKVTVLAPTRIQLEPPC